MFVLCMINLFANSAYSSIAPFFPAEGKKKGLPVSTFGLIFAGYSFAMFVFAPLFSHMLSYCGRKRVLIFGCLFEAIAMVAFGLFDFINNPLAYGIMCFVCRFIEGFGNGCLNSATNSIIAHKFKDNASNLIGLTQTFTGLGMLMGPIMGSALYEAGGFMMPFFVCGGLLFLLTIPIICLLENDSMVEREEEDEKKRKQSNLEPINEERQEDEVSQ